MSGQSLLSEMKFECKMDIFVAFFFQMKVSVKLLLFYAALVRNRLNCDYAVSNFSYVFSVIGHSCVCVHVCESSCVRVCVDRL